jgi:hypothetical protein
MPASNAGFDKHLLTLTVSDTEWNYYQAVELFFHYDGTSAGGGTTPNWFYYWSEIRSPAQGTGNTAGLTFQGTATAGDCTWGYNGSASPTVITITPRNSLTDFVGMVAHEERHELDFFDEIWGGTGYNAAHDSDADAIRDAWEQAQFGNLTRGFSYVFETSNVHFAWSDDRADLAARDEVNANITIDLQDWSDVRLPPQYRYTFRDDNPPDNTHDRTTNWITAGNNKDYP